jgi:hypothetical protein
VEDRVFGYALAARAIGPAIFVVRDDAPVAHEEHRRSHDAVAVRRAVEE